MTLPRIVFAAVALGAALGFHHLEPSLTYLELKSAFGILISAAATILGFLVSAGALLYAVTNTSLVNNLQKTGHFKSLLGDLFLCAGFFLVAVVLGLVCLFLPEKSAGTYDILGLGAAALIFVNAVAYLLMLPVGWKMWLLLTSIKPSSPNRIG